MSFFTLRIESTLCPIKETVSQDFLFAAFSIKTPPQCPDSYPEAVSNIAFTEILEFETDPLVWPSLPCWIYCTLLHMLMNMYMQMNIDMKKNTNMGMNTETKTDTDTVADAETDTGTNMDTGMENGLDQALT
jgi:hypothetical protein